LIEPLPLPRNNFIIPPPPLQSSHRMPVPRAEEKEIDEEIVVDEAVSAQRSPTSQMMTMQLITD
jgi:hypothetical protein